MNEVLHPDIEQIASFHLGTLPLEKVNALVAHLDGCQDCRVRAEGLEGKTDLFVSCLRCVAEVPPEDPAQHKLMDYAARMPRKNVGLPASQAPLMVAGLEVIRELARGGLGVVYLARHPVLGALRRSSDRSRAARNSGRSCSPGSVARSGPWGPCGTITSSVPSTPVTTPKVPTW